MSFFRFSLRISIALFLILLTQGLMALAQDYQASAGRPTFAVTDPTESGFVNVANGNLVIKIPLASYPQRKMTPEEIYWIYESNQTWWISCGQGTCIWDMHRSAEDANGTLVSGLITGNIKSSRAGATVVGIYCGDSLVENDGTTRYFWGGTNCSSQSGANVYASDSSGFLAPGNYAGCGSGTVAAYAPNGDSFVWSCSGGYGIRYVDTNGNGDGIGATFGISTDTLGRVTEECASGCSGPNGSNAYGYTLLLQNSQSTSLTTPNVSYSVIQKPINVNTKFNQANVSENSLTVYVPYQLVLPDGNAYTFKWDCDSGTGNVACGSPTGQSAYYGTITSLTLPTGATINYGYGMFSDVYGNKQRWLTSRSSPAGTTTYSQAVVSSCSSSQAGLNCTQQVTQTNPDGSKKIATFAIDNGAWPVKVQSYDNTGALVSTVTNTFDLSNACLFNSCVGNVYIRLLTTQTAIPSSNGTLTNQTTYGYDSRQKGNVTSVKEWNYQLGSSFPSTPDRATYYTLTTIGANTNRRLSATVCNNVGSDASCIGGGGKVAQTTYTYDSYGANCPQGGLAPVVGVSNHDDQNYGASFTQRGNPTTIQNWVSSTTTVSTQLCYDTTGQVTAVFDGNGNKALFSYADNFYNDSSSLANPPTPANPTTPTNAYLTKVTPPVTAPTTFGYYLGSGKLASSVDPNGADTYFHYVDLFDRLTHSFLPITNGNRAWTLTNYTTLTQTDFYSTVNGASPSSSCTSCQHSQHTLDTLGRPIQAALQNDPDGATLTAISYDSAGRTHSVSNPYRTMSDSTYGSSTVSYDSASRPNVLTEADGSTVKAYYGTQVTGVGGIASQLCNTSTYGNGFPSLSIDEAGKKKQSWTDAFGRTIEVDEPNSSGTLTLATCYAYDVLNNLTKVVQQGGAGSSLWRIRTLAYDGLSRLLSSTDPESGTTTFSYDSNGNLLTRTSPAPNSSAGSPGTGSVTISGSERSIYVPAGCSGSYRWDGGTLTVFVNGSQVANIPYGSTGSNSCTAPSPMPTSASLAAQLAAAINNSGLVGATANGSTIVLTSTTSGANTNYSLSTQVFSTFVAAGAGPASFSLTTSGSTLTGGTDPSNQTVTVSYCYDALNRPTAKAYTYSPSTPPTCSGTPPTLPSPIATYLYDQTAFNGLTITNGIGRRTGMTDAAGSEAWSYDAQGNVLVDQRTTNGVTKTTSYTYNLDGSLASVKYPSGNTVTYTPGNAGQSLSAVDQGNSVNYVTSAHYSPAGALAALTNGLGISSTFVYNSRLQPCWIYATTTTALPWNTTNCSGTATSGTLLDLKLNFGSANNGNVVSTTNNRDNTRSQNFTYDTLNRLASAQTQTTGVTIPNANCWGLTFGYDGWNNLLTSTASGPVGCSEPLPLNVSVGNTNRISGFCYDAGGSLVDPAACPSGAHAYTYNAENQLVSAGGVNYTYDGDGRRLQKSNGKIYWYGISASPLETTDLSGNSNNSTFAQYIFFGGSRIARRDYQGNVVYYFSDHLGSSRVIASSAGVILDDLDFYPFGGERPVTSSSGNQFKFTGYERDPESGLDYASARHYSSVLGRFTSPDPIIGALENPQSWNRYSYVLNNPINNTDSSGLCPDGSGNDDGLPCPGDFGESDLTFNGIGLDGSTCFGCASNDQLSFWTNADFNSGTPPSQGVVDSFFNTIGNYIEDATQTFLRTLGLVPGLGTVTNGMSAGISLARGNYGDAALDGLGMIPFESDAAAGIRLTDETVTIYHGTTTNAASKILRNGFRAGGDGAVFFGEDFQTAKFFGERRMAESGARSGQVLQYTMSHSLADKLGLTSRQVLGEFRNAPWVDIPGASGFERILNGDDIGAFNDAVRDGRITVAPVRIRF